MTKTMISWDWTPYSSGPRMQQDAVEEKDHKAWDPPIDLVLQNNGRKDWLLPFDRYSVGSVDAEVFSEATMRSRRKHAGR